MKIIIQIFIIFIFCGCTSYLNYENFKERKGVARVVFQGNMEGCEKFRNLQATRSEGSKRAGEILIDKKRYFMSCMNRKGWFSKVSK